MEGVGEEVGEYWGTRRVGARREERESQPGKKYLEKAREGREYTNFPGKRNGKTYEARAIHGGRKKKGLRKNGRSKGRISKKNQKGGVNPDEGKLSDQDRRTCATKKKQTVEAQTTQREKCAKNGLSSQSVTKNAESEKGERGGTKKENWLADKAGRGRDNPGERDENEAPGKQNGYFKPHGAECRVWGKGHVGGKHEWNGRSVLPVVEKRKKKKRSNSLPR